MLMGERVGSSSEEETVIVAAYGHPVNPHQFEFKRDKHGGKRVEAVHPRRLLRCLAEVLQKAGIANPAHVPFLL